MFPTICHQLCNTDAEYMTRNAFYNMHICSKHSQVYSKHRISPLPLVLRPYNTENTNTIVGCIYKLMWSYQNFKGIE